MQERRDERLQDVANAQLPVVGGGRLEAEEGDVIVRQGECPVQPPEALRREGLLRLEGQPRCERGRVLRLSVVQEAPRAWPRRHEPDLCELACHHAAHLGVQPVADEVEHLDRANAPDGGWRVDVDHRLFAAAAPVGVTPQAAARNRRWLGLGTERGARRKQQVDRLLAARREGRAE